MEVKPFNAGDWLAVAFIALVFLGVVVALDSPRVSSSLVSYEARYAAR